MHLIVYKHTHIEKITELSLQGVMVFFKFVYPFFTKLIIN